MPRALPLLALVLLPLCGCGSLNVSLQGTIRSPLTEPTCSSEERPVVLAFDRLGNLTVNGQVLDLPATREGERLGVRVVDVGAAPPPFRPKHAAEGGLLVASLEKGSPLAIAGLRPFDRIDTAGERPTGGLEALHRYLSAREGTALALGVTHPDGSEGVVRAVVGERIGEAGKVSVPLLFDYRDSPTGTALGLAPLDALFYVRSEVDHDYTLEGQVGHSEYRARFEWGALANLILWESSEDLRTGKRKSRLRLLWFLSFGDDVP